MARKNDMAAVSLPKERTICGVVIKKMPLGRYLQALEALKTAPAELLEACFPGAASLEEALNALSGMDRSGLGGLFEAVFTVVPAYVLSLVEVFTGLKKDELLGSEEIGLGELVEIIEAIVEVNGLGKFADTLKKTMSARSLTNAGSKS